MKFGDLKMRPDVLVFQAFGIYRQHVRNGMISDPEGKYIAAAQVLDAAAVPRDAIRLAFLCAMPPQTHNRLAREELRADGGRMVGLIREYQRMGVEDYRGLWFSPDEVKAVVLGLETARLQFFTMNMEKFREAARARTLDNPQVPVFADMERCEDFRDVATGGAENLHLDLLFRETLDKARPHYEASVRLIRALGMPNPEAEAARLEQRAPFEETRLPDSSVVRMAYGLAGGAPLVRGRDFEAAVNTGVLLSTIPRVAESTIAAALVDVALRGRDPERPLPFDLGADVARTLENRSIYTVEKAGEMEKAPVEFRQIFLAHSAQELKDNLSGGAELVRAAARREVSRGQLREVFRELAQQKNYLRRVALPAAGKTDAPALDRLFRRRYGAFVRMLEAQRKKTGRRPAP